MRDFHAASGWSHTSFPSLGRRQREYFPDVVAESCKGWCDHDPDGVGLGAAEASRSVSFSRWARLRRDDINITSETVNEMLRCEVVGRYHEAIGSYWRKETRDRTALEGFVGDIVIHDWLLCSHQLCRGRCGRRGRRVALLVACRLLGACPSIRTLRRRDLVHRAKASLRRCEYGNAMRVWRAPGGVSVDVGFSREHKRDGPPRVGSGGGGDASIAG